MGVGTMGVGLVMLVIELNWRWEEMGGGEIGGGREGERERTGNSTRCFEDYLPNWLGWDRTRWTKCQSPFNSNI